MLDHAFTTVIYYTCATALFSTVFRFAQYPKNFEKISSFIPNKVGTVEPLCVFFFFILMIILVH